MARLRRSHRFVLAVLGVLPVLAAVRAPIARTETLRIRAHFDSVLTELRGRDVSSLGADRRAKRAALIGELQRYRDEGVFPHNYDFPGRPTPYFVDRKTGTLCAVANLLAYTGRRDIVDRVAKTNNNVWVRDLARDASFVAWLDYSGLTLAEAARIQVPYVVTTSPAEQARQVSFYMMVPLAFAGTATSVMNASDNRDGHSSAVSWLGVATGFGSLLAGASLFTESPTARASAIGTLGLTAGTVSLATAMYSITKRRELDRSHQNNQKTVAAAIVPTVSAQGGAGLGVAVRF